MNLAIKLPDTIREIIQTFPLLHAINKILNDRWENEEIDNYQIHLICLDKIVNVLNLLPIKAYYHQLEEEDTKNVFSIHRAIKNATLDNVDVFVSTTRSFVDASIGKNLNAKTRVGFGIGKNKVFFNKNISFLEGQHASNIFFNLIQFLDLDEIPKIPNVTVRNLDSYYPDYRENPYFVINLKLNEEKRLDSQWIDFFELFKDQNFILCMDGDAEIVKDSIESLISTLPKGNHYKFFDSQNVIDFGKMISYSKGFFTGDSDLLYIAAYCGATCFWMNEKLNASLEFPEYFYSDVKRYDAKQLAGNFSSVFDDIYSFLDVKEDT